MKKVLIVLTLLAILITLAIFLFIGTLSKNNVPLNTYVAGEDISSTKYDNLEDELNKIVDDKKVKFQDSKIGEVEYSLSELGIKPKEDLETIKDKGPFKWLNFQEENKTAEYLDIDENKIKESVDSLIEEAGMESPQNAYIYFEDGSYKVAKEKESKMIDSGSISKAIEENVKVDRYNITTSEYYAPPTILEADLKDEVDELNSMLSKNVTLKFGKKKYKLSNGEISQFIKVKKDGTYEIKKADFEAYVNQLASSYNTLEYTAKKRTQNRFNGAGTSDKFASGLLDKDKKEVEIDVPNDPFVKNLTQKSGATEKTYVEVNLSSQYMWYYKNGKLFMSSPVVTGDNSNEWDTPTGKFSLLSKTTDTILKGATVGFDYNYHVDYWMPITSGGVGLHDTVERAPAEYGSDTYLSGGGSHGCINMPPANAKKLYENITVGTPVYVTA